MHDDFEIEEERQNELLELLFSASGIGQEQGFINGFQLAIAIMSECNVFYTEKDI